MLDNNEYLGRDKPVQVPVQDFAFEQHVSGERLQEIEHRGATCLARVLSEAAGHNSANDVTRGAIIHGYDKVLPDGSRQRFNWMSRV